MTNEGRNIFLAELKKVPDRNALKVMQSRERILRIAKTINFKAIEEILSDSQEYELRLMKGDIPQEMLFRANFFFTLSMEFEEELETRGEWHVYEVWKLENPDTFRMVERYATLIGGKEASIYDAYFFNLDAVMQYATSKKPDLR